MVEQAMEMHKRKAIECSQSSADFKAQLEKCSSQLNDAQQVPPWKLYLRMLDELRMSA